MTSPKNDASKADELLARDSKYILRPWSAHGEPVPVVKARDCTVTDAYGKEFLDFTSGYFVNNAGHCHPKVVAAATEQMGKVLQVSGRHTTPALVGLAERLVKSTPKSIGKVFFATGGSEANEFALKMVRHHTGKTDIAALENAYHGLTLGVLPACAAKKYRDTAGVDMGDNTYRLPTPYCYRCKYADDCQTQCLDGADETIAARPKTAALLAEPIQSVGGVIPPQKWWDRADSIRKKHGLLLILDEIQTGVGRTGKMWAAEHYGLEPDLMTGGKGLSGGVGSLAVVMANDQVVETFYAGTTPTNGGNAVSAAAGSAMLDIIVDEGIIDNAAKMGDYFTGAVADLNDPWVGDIRFKGLLGGVELVSDRESKEVLPWAQVSELKDRLHEDGMLLTISGMHKNVLRLQPPLTITAKQLDQFVELLKKNLSAVRQGAR